LGAQGTCVGFEQLVAEGVGLALGISDDTLAVATFIFFFPQLDVFSSFLEHGIDQAGRLAGRGGDGLGCAEVSPLAAEESTQGGVAVVEAEGRQAESGGGPVGVGLGAGAELLAAGGLASRGESQPGGEILPGGPAGHTRTCMRCKCVEADLSDEFEGGLGVDALDGGQVDAGEAEEMRAHRKGAGSSGGCDGGWI
jgi:hypothetical protein